MMRRAVLRDPPPPPPPTVATPSASRCFLICSYKSHFFYKKKIEKGKYDK